MPVVDDGKILGIVTVDDIIDTMIEETTEDVHRFGGMEALDEPYMKMSFLADDPEARRLAVRAVPQRDADGQRHADYEGELEKAIVLTLFIPLIMSSGGNSGSQATSLVIRALALREIGLGDWWRVALRELPTGLVLGSMLGVVGICAHHALAVSGLLRLRPALAVDRHHDRRGAGRHRHLRLRHRVDAAVRPETHRLRPGQRVGAVRRHAGRRDRAWSFISRWRW